MGTTPRKRPIPRDEPEDAAAPEEPATVRPPAFADEAVSSTYEMLRESCRNLEAAEPHDEELAIEAEILRVALDRTSQRTKM